MWLQSFKNNRSFWKLYFAEKNCCLRTGFTWRPTFWSWSKFYLLRSINWRGETKFSWIKKYIFFKIVQALKHFILFCMGKNRIFFTFFTLNLNVLLNLTWNNWSTCRIRPKRPSLTRSAARRFLSTAASRSCPSRSTLQSSTAAEVTSVLRQEEVLSEEERFINRRKDPTGM